MLRRAYDGGTDRAAGRRVRRRRRRRAQADRAGGRRRHGRGTGAGQAAGRAADFARARGLRGAGDGRQAAPRTTPTSRSIARRAVSTSPGRWTSPSPRAANFTPQDAWIAHSDDGGKTFSKPVRANRDLGTVNAGFNTQTRIAATGEDRLFATWPLMNDDMSKMNAMATLSTDGGKTFAPEAAGLRLGRVEDDVEMYHAVATYGRNVYVGYLDYREDISPKMPTGVNIVHSGRRRQDVLEVDARRGQLLRVAATTGWPSTPRAPCTSPTATSTRSPRTPRSATRPSSAATTTARRGRTRSSSATTTGSSTAAPSPGPSSRSTPRTRLHAVYWTGKPGRPGVYYTRSDDGGVVVPEADGRRGRRVLPAALHGPRRRARRHGLDRLGRPAHQGSQGAARTRQGRQGRAAPRPARHGRHARDRQRRLAGGHGLVRAPTACRSRRAASAAKDGYGSGLRRRRLRPAREGRT